MSTLVSVVMHLCRGFLVRLCVLLFLICAPLSLIRAAEPLFEAPLGYGFSGARSFVFADLNKDGLPDIVATTVEGCVVLFNEGYGVFRSAVRYQVGSSPSAIVSYDFDGNGETDLAVALPAIGQVAILLNSGDGVLDSTVFLPVRDHSYYDAINSLATADLNSDGAIDIVASGPKYIFVLLNGGNGAFQSSVEYYIGGVFGTFVSIADLNGDTFPDLIATTFYGDNVITKLNKGDGTFGDPTETHYFPSDWTATVPPYVGDLDDDGDIDVAIGGIGITTLMNDGDGNLGQPIKYLADVNPSYICGGDLDNDNDIDLVISDPSFERCSKMYVLLNSSGTFSDYYTCPTGTGTGFASAFDIDLDGRADLAFVTTDRIISILVNENNGEFRSAQCFSDLLWPTALVAADLNGDHRDDLAIVYLDSDSLTIAISDDLGAFVEIKSYDVGSSNARSICTTDLDADGDLDLAVANGNAQKVMLLQNSGSGSFTIWDSLSVPNGAFSIISEDMNSDGLSDLVVAGFHAPSSLDIFLKSSAGNFGLPLHYDVGFFPQAICARDFNHDGDEDLAIVNGIGRKSITILNNNGDSTFAPQLVYHFARDFSTNNISSVDFDKDGDLDLAVVCSDSSVWFLNGKGDGTFEQPSSVPIGVPLGSCLASDFDLDGWPDIAITNYSGMVVVLRNIHNGSFVLDPFVYGVGRGASWLSVGDFDGDEKPDLAVANSSDNTVSVLRNTTQSVPTSAEDEIRNSRPADFALHQNFPNPFNPHTEIEFSLPKSSRVTLRIFNVLGQQIVTVVDDILGPGKFRTEWDGKDAQGAEVPSGVYLYRLEAGDHVENRKMILLK